MCFVDLGAFSARPHRRIFARGFTVPAVLVFLLGLAATSSGYADSLGRDTGATNVQNVTDITGGMHYLLVDDDLSLLQVSVNGNQVTTQLVTYDTANSKFAGNPEYTNVSQVNTNGQYSTSGVPAAQASARLFASKADVLAALTEGNGPVWQLSLVDFQSNFSYQGALTTSFAPYGTVYTQIATGDFLGNNLDDLLVFCCSLDSQKVDWGLKALTAVDPAKEAAPQEGPEFYGNGERPPVRKLRYELQLRPAIGDASDLGGLSVAAQHEGRQLRHPVSAVRKPMRASGTAQPRAANRNLHHRKRAHLLDVIPGHLQGRSLQDKAQAARNALTAYIQAVTAASGKVISAEHAQRLIGQASALLECTPGASSGTKTQLALVP